MNALRVGAAVCLVGLSSSLAISQIGWTRHSQPIIIDDSESARTILIGRVVNVEPFLYEGPQGGIQATVRLSTIDDRGLPPIGTVRIRVVDRRQPPWTGYMQAYAQGVFNQTELYLVADGGPRIPIGSLVSVRVEIGSSGHVSTVIIPVTVQAM
jgi:hypothetical protein